MPKSLAVHQQVDFPVYGNGHLSGYDVVFGILVVRGVKTVEIACSFVDLIGVNGAELSIRARVAEVKSKLLRLDLDPAMHPPPEE